MVIRNYKEIKEDKIRQGMAGERLRSLYKIRKWLSLRRVEKR